MRILQPTSIQDNQLSNLGNPLAVNSTGLTKQETGTAIASALTNTIYDTIDSALENITIPISGFFEFNVKDYGAVGDGVTDDTDALQNTFIAMINGGERNILRIPPGIYKFTRPLVWVSGSTPFNIIAEGSVLLYTANNTEVAISIGSSGSTMDRCFIIGLDVYKETRNWSVPTSGVNFINLFACQVQDFSVTSFQTGFILTGYNKGNSYNRFTLNRIRGNQYGVSLSKSGAGGYVTQQLFIGGSWNTGTVATADYQIYKHVNFSEASSLYGTFHFSYCAFEGSFDTYSTSCSGYAFDVNVTNVTFHHCRYEFMAGAGHYPAYGYFGPSSSFSTVHHVHSTSNIVFVNKGTYNQIWYADRMNTVQETTSAFRPILNGRIGINRYNSVTYGLHVMYDAYLSESDIGSSGIMQVGELSPTLGATALSVYSGTGTGLYASTYTGTPISAIQTNQSVASHSTILSLAHALSGGVSPTAGSFGTAISFRGALEGTSSLGAMGLIYCTSDDVTLENKRGRFRFLTYGGSGVYTGLQIGNTGLGGEATLGFYGNSPAVKPTVSGETLGTGISSLLSGLSSIGLINDNTSPLTYLHLLWSASSSGDSTYKSRFGGNDASNNQIGGFFESGSNYAIWAQTRSGIPIYSSILGSSATSDPTALMLINIATGVTPSVGFGTSIVCSASVSGGGTARQMLIRNTWANAGATTYKSRWRIFAYDYPWSTNAREVIRGESSGTAPMIGFLGANASPTIGVSGHVGDGSFLVSLGNALSTFGLITTTVLSSGSKTNFIVAIVSGSPSSPTLTINSPEVIFADDSGTITLPSASSTSGKLFTIKRRGSSNVTIAAAGSDTIDGSSSIVLSTIYQSVRLISDGTNWNVL